ncbi:hypothetical protein FisN_3Lh375 [Fistulifera solaris]|uniref:BSD domain-containing protein n=1 Tax=Fistulifera solaris TaxID=1519565 RepID=A0A1Z5J865_FISSO|nr:hypothetical protein FisN_3Lh375 [Fistulifera solaris]|eukprot:GAX10180.1 hypothetical protein FisN_3Lh375 [Fistulifera solaris]
MIHPRDKMEPEMGETTTVKEKKADNSADELGSTTTSDSSSFSGEENFFEALGSDFRLLAASFRETAGGVASFVQRSAMTVAAELSRLEESELTGECKSGEIIPLNLPWVIKVDEDSDYQEILVLKERIMALSREDSTFFGSHATADSPSFSLDEPRIQLIRRLLELDENLATSHARLSGRVDVKETEFWKNYFDRCRQEVEGYLSQHDQTNDVQYQAEPNAPNQQLEGSNADCNIGTGSPNSLVRADTPPEPDVDFVLATPPMSGNSVGGKSVDSFVIIDKFLQR